MWEDEDDLEVPNKKDDDRAEHPKVSWTAVATIVLAVTVPLCGWLVTLSNRVSALEVRTESLATAAQMAAVEQKITDWIEEFERSQAAQRQREESRSK